jgi:hypothetical protein
VLHKAAAAPAPRAEEPRAVPRNDIPHAKSQPAPRPVHNKPEAPPLGGAKSLREALEAATGKKSDAPQPQRPGSHTPDLKDALHKVAPQAQAKPKEPDAPAPPRKPELTPNQLQKMLAVDEFGNE